MSDDHVLEQDCKMRVTLMNKTLSEIKEDTRKINNAISGNGKPEEGIMFRLLFLERAVALNTQFIANSKDKRDGYITLIFRTIILALLSYIFVKIGIK